jgi:hypothetical protein
VDQVHEQHDMVLSASSARAGAGPRGRVVFAGVASLERREAVRRELDLRQRGAARPTPLCVPVLYATVVVAAVPVEEIW